MAGPMTANTLTALRMLADSEWAVIGMRTGDWGNLVIAGPVANALLDRGYAQVDNHGARTTLTTIVITDTGRKEAAK